MLPQLQLVAGSVERERERESKEGGREREREGERKNGKEGERGRVRREMEREREGKGEGDGGRARREGGRGRGRENQISDRCLHRTSNTFPSVKVDEQWDLGISLSTMCALCLNCVADSHWHNRTIYIILDSIFLYKMKSGRMWIIYYIYSDYIKSNSVDCREIFLNFLDVDNFHFFDLERFWFYRGFGVGMCRFRGGAFHVVRMWD